MRRPRRRSSRSFERRNCRSMGVIVASHNEATVLPVTLAALLARRTGPAQIVIADDGSTDAHPRAAHRTLRPDDAR